LVFEGIVAILLIVLIFAMYFMVTGGLSSSSSANSKSLVLGNDTVSNLFLGKDGTIYTFMGTGNNVVYALDGNGNIKWKYEVPDGWQSQVLMAAPDIGTPTQAPVYAEDNGTFYLCIGESFNESVLTNGTLVDNRIIAISPEGNVLWNVSIGSDNSAIGSEHLGLSAEAGRVYAFNDGNETVFGNDGVQLFTISNISDSPAVDENGDIYAVKMNFAWPDSWVSQNTTISITDTYYPNGTLNWQRSIPENITRYYLQPESSEFTSLPIYFNGSLYVAFKNGVYALNTNGAIMWNVSINNTYSVQLYQNMPLDDEGNVYLWCTGYDEQPWNVTEYIAIISNNGSNVIQRYLPSAYMEYYGDPYNGVLYYVSNFTNTQYSMANNMIKPLPALYQLYGIQLTAYDLLNDKALWNTTLTLNNTNSFIFSQVNASNVLSSWELGDILSTAEQYATYQKEYNMNESAPPENSYDFNVLPAGNVTYVSYQSSNLESPYVVNQSLCVYGSALFALDRNGTILWSIPTSTYPTVMVANNSTIYYGTRGGSFGSVGTGVAGGLALMALVFVFFKFFMAGTVSRARSRLGLNDNRNVVLSFIVENPGSTMSDIARLTGINLGTVRYHLLILGINHRIVTSKTDDKSIRYFTNAGSYNSEDQFIISLMRRDSIRKVLGLLARSPGLTNIELSRELNIQESAVSRYMKELQEKGVVVRSNAQDIHNGRFSYSIKNEYKEKVATAIERIGSG